MRLAIGLILLFIGIVVPIISYFIYWSPYDGKFDKKKFLLIFIGSTLIMVVGAEIIASTL